MIEKEKKRQEEEEEKKDRTNQRERKSKIKEKDRLWAGFRRGRKKIGGRSKPTSTKNIWREKRAERRF